MKKLFILFLFFPLWSYAAPSILGATSTSNVIDTVASPLNVPHTVPAGGSNTALIVEICMSGPDGITSVKWQGTTLARLASFSGVAQCSGYLYYIGLPAVATNGTLQFNGVANNIGFTAFTLQDVLQSTTTVMEGFGQAGNGTNVTKDSYATTTVSGNPFDLVLDWGALGNGATGWTSTQGTNLFNNTGTTVFGFGSDYMTATTTNVLGTLMGITWTTVKTDDFFVASIRGSAVAATPPPPQIPSMLMIFGKVKSWLVNTAYAVTPTERVLLRKVGNQKLSLTQARQVVAILNNYLKNQRIVLNRNLKLVPALIQQILLQ